MSYTFVKVAPFYESFLESFYRENPYAADLPYAEQLAQIMNQRFGWSDVFARNLIPLGVDAHEIISNAIPLQKAWAQENGLSSDASLSEILWSQLCKLSPEVLFWENPVAVGRRFILRCKTHIKNLKTTIGWCACPFTKNDLYVYSACDLMLTSGVNFLEDFTSVGIPSRLMRHGFDKDLIAELPQGETCKTSDVSFAGSFYNGKGLHNIRWDFFKELLHAGLDIKIYTSLPKSRLVELVGEKEVSRFLSASGLQLTENSLMTSAHYQAITAFFEEEGKQQPLRLLKAFNGPVFGREMYAALARSKIGMNLHIDAAGNSAGGLRIFEVTGVGSCLVTDTKKDLGELFEIDTEIKAFSTLKECSRTIEYLLCNSSERQAISKAGQQKTLTAHSWGQRALELESHIADLLAGNIASRKKHFFLPSLPMIAREYLPEKTVSFLRAFKQKVT